MRSLRSSTRRSGKKKKNVEEELEVSSVSEGGTMHVSFHELKSSVTVAACLRWLYDDKITADY